MGGTLADYAASRGRGRAAVIGNTLKGGAEQGWYVADYVQAAHPDLKSVADLPRFAGLFTDPEAPDKARFLNCPSGWTCETFNTRLLANSGLNTTFNNVHPGTGAALDAAIASAYEQRKPLLFYYWQPTGLMAKYRFVPLEFRLTMKPAGKICCKRATLRPACRAFRLPNWR